MNRYSKYYSENSLLKKVRQFASKAGQKVIYPVLILYYMLKDKNVDLKTKLIITAALGYFIFPADLIPDLAPIIGFTDDFGVLMVALTRLAGRLTPEIREKVKTRLKDWFSDVDKNKTVEIDKKILNGSEKD